MTAPLIRHARRLYAGDSIGVGLDGTVHCLSSGTIDLCLSLPERAPFRATNAAVKVHPWRTCVAPSPRSCASASACPTTLAYWRR